MLDISKFTSKSTIKPELAHIYVYENSNGQKIAVATDSYRLIELTITDPVLEEHLIPGYYQAKDWVTICKALNKTKIDITTALNTITQAQALAPLHKTYRFPEYKKIIPDDKDLKPLDLATSVYNVEYFFDFLDIVKEKKPKVSINFSKIQQTQDNRMIVYKNPAEGIIALLMSMNK